MKVTPKPGYVYIKTFDETKKGSIEVPKSHRKKLKIGEILSVSDEETELSVGDRVHYTGRPFAGFEDETIVIPKEKVLIHEQS